ncbi:hypothetical protein V8G54_009527 [Vigna mungo]|uniref:Uncharacterized protein n=1 Tax=Vigna mungo TaxID=3915 RepID=A0AAQ3NUN1_VIGMU
MLQTEVSNVGNKILNFECVFLLPESRRQAIPLEATFKTIFRGDRKVDDKVFHMKVFLIPPYLYKIKHSAFILTNNVNYYVENFFLFICRIKYRFKYSFGPYFCRLC